MSVLETILYFVVPVIAAYVIITLLVAGPKLSRRPRYRAGQPWPYEPLFFTANPQGAHLEGHHDSGPHQPGHPQAGHEHTASGARAGAERGGARGSW